MGPSSSAALCHHVVVGDDVALVVQHEAGAGRAARLAVELRHDLDGAGQQLLGHRGHRAVVDRQRRLGAGGPTGEAVVVEAGAVGVPAVVGRAAERAPEQADEQGQDGDRGPDPAGDPTTGRGRRRAVGTRRAPGRVGLRTLGSGTVHRAERAGRLRAGVRRGAVRGRPGAAARVGGVQRQAAQRLGARLGRPSRSRISGVSEGRALGLLGSGLGGVVHGTIFTPGTPAWARRGTAAGLRAAWPRRSGGSGW